MEQKKSEELFHQWLSKGQFTKDGITYKAGVNNETAIRAMVPDNYKMIGKVCFLSSELTLTNSDLNDDYHEGFTIEKGKTLYWMLIWHGSGHCTVYSKEGVKPRWIEGDTEITVHFKK